MEKKIILISPKKLYPTEGLASIENDTLDRYYRILCQGKCLEMPKVFVFENYHYILKGHHIVLASILAQKKEIEVEVVDVNCINFWREPENIKDTLSAVGMCGLYDFETIGNFFYEEYPNYYKEK